jgi:hypothetical protein
MIASVNAIDDQKTTTAILPRILVVLKLVETVSVF